MAPGVNLGVALVILAALGGTDEFPCPSSESLYRRSVETVQQALHDYMQCVQASNGREDCSNEFGDLQLAHDRFAIVVTDLARQCR